MLSVAVMAGLVSFSSFWGGGGVRGPSKIDAAVSRFSQLTAAGSSTVALVYARQAESALQAEGVQATRAKNANSPLKPWFFVGRVAAPSAADVRRAIHAQRALLVETAQQQHKPLRFLTSLSLAYAVAETDDAQQLPTAGVRLGSFRCDSCGAFNEAHAQSCTNCGSPRSADAPPPGGLTLAVAPQRERPLPLESCGFAPSEAEDGGGEAG